MKLAFTKMHGTGNDFVVLDRLHAPLPDPAGVARQVCDRRLGIGADQLLLVEPSPVPEAEFRMAIYNADGSRVEMCGNGIRCFAKYLRDHGHTPHLVIRVHTDAGIVVSELRPDGHVRVDMGEPVLDGRRIPSTFDGQAVARTLKVLDRQFEVTLVSLGNPHCAIFVEDVDGFPVEKYGAATERHPVFPHRTNVEYVQVIDRLNLKIRIWERGVGETLSCGTGASAALVAAALNQKSERAARLQVRGGQLSVEWRAADNHVFMTGPAVEVFQGSIELAPALDN